MATVEECEQAFHALANRLAAVDPEVRRRKTLDRSLTCALRDPDVVFGAHLQDGLLHDIQRVANADGQVKLSMSGDTLLDLVAGRTGFASAWASGHVKVDARVMDLLKLRSLF